MTETARPAYDGGYRPDLARLCYRVLWAFSRVWFRFRFRGAERLPKRTCLLVGNHSAIGIADVMTIVGTAHSHFPGRRMVGMMHNAIIGLPVIGFFARSFGAVPANREAAEAALAAGYDVVTYPGGNLDSCRPFTQHRRVIFGPRRGYVRLALRMKVPIVPIATIGSHWTYVMMPADPLARLIRLNRWTRDDRLPVPLALVLLLAAIVPAALGFFSPWWLLLGIPLVLFPSPMRVTSEMLPAIDVAAATAHLDDEEERVELAHRLVHQTLIDAVGALRHHEPLPDDKLSTPSASADTAGH